MFVLVCLETGKVHNLADLQIYANLILKLKMKVFWWFTTTDTYRLPWKMSNKNIFIQAHQDTSWPPDLIIPNVFSTCSSRCLLGIHKLSGSPQNCQQAQSGQKSQNQEEKKWNLHVLGTRIILLECHIFIYCLFFFRSNACMCDPSLVCLSMSFFCFLHLLLELCLWEPLTTLNLPGECGSPRTCLKHFKKW